MDMDDVQPARVLTIGTLPPEITQRFLALCDPVDVANFAQTSRASWALVYDSVDQYLWRELFLALFDDPRVPFGDNHAWSRASKVNNWHYYLTKGVSARQYLRSLGRQLHLALSQMDEDSEVPDFRSFVHSDKLKEILETTTVLLDTAKMSPRAAWDTDESFRSKNLTFLSSALSDPLVQVLVFDYSPEEVRPLAARLHVLNGFCASDDIKRKRGKAREKVYQLSRYSPKNRWGPYHADFSRRPDWEQLEAMMQIVWKNVEERKEEWDLEEEDYPVFGFDQTRAYTLRSSKGQSKVENVEGDWAGVQGKWYRTVCFMDYRDLWAYNFGGVLNYNADFMCTYQEAVRIMSFTLEIVAIGEPPADRTFPIRGAHVRTPPLIKMLTTPPESRRATDEAETSSRPGLTHPLPRSLYLPSPLLDSSPSSSSSSSESSLFSPMSSSSGPFSPISPYSADSSNGSPKDRTAAAYPTIYFTGIVQSSDNYHPKSFVHGRVERTAAGDTVWKMTSNYDGQDRWVSEGVQIGGAQSRAGVLGIWSDAMHEHEGPAGPFWFWKASH